MFPSYSGIPHVEKNNFTDKNLHQTKTKNYTFYTDHIVDCKSFAIALVVFWFGIDDSKLTCQESALGRPKHYSYHYKADS